MRVTLIHNPESGHGRGATKADQLIALVRGGGHEVHYQSTKDKDFPSALREPADLIVAAGGDGTVTKVAQRLGDNRAMAVLPLGTANNIAHSLGLHGDLDEMAARWSTASARRVDLWSAAAGERNFVVLEGCGLGIICDTAAALRGLGDTEALSPNSKLATARNRLRAIAENAQPVRARIWCDGAPIDGDFLFVEVLNLPMVGPRLTLVAGADFADGLLDVLLLRSDERLAFCNWLDAGAPTSFAARPSLRCRRVELEFEHGLVRIGDNTFWPGEDKLSAAPVHNIALGPAGRGVDILAPALSQARRRSGASSR